MKYLFLFTIGPVQGFISQARKTQDLYHGSRLLSHLAYTARKIAEEKGATIVLPSAEADSAPNRFVAIYEGDKNVATKIGHTVESAVRREIKRIADKILEGFSINSHPDGFYEQIEKYFQVYWVFIPYQTEDYQSAYSNLERTMSSLKNLRHFEPLVETGRKCTLMPGLNAFFYRDEKPKAPSQQILLNCEQYHIPLKYCAKGEYLSAVGLLKRAFDQSGEHESEFPSIAMIAVMDKIDLAAIQKTEKQQQWDSQFLYEENITEPYIKKCGLATTPENIRAINKELLGNYKPEQLHKYYAVLQFDGDHMGQHLSGKLLREKINLKDFHDKLSASLSKFALECAKLIQPDNGVTVYAGGDDFLGFLNLTFLLKGGLKEVYDKFQTWVATPLQSQLRNGNLLSFSAGIAIAHYKTPLSEVLRWARNMERMAKEEGGRNAFAMAVLKHSGEINSTCYKWNSDHGFLPAKIMEIVRELANERLSDSFMQHLWQEFATLDIDENIGYKDKMLVAEIERLLLRSTNLEAEEVQKRDYARRYTGILTDFYFKSRSTRNFFELFNVINFLAREGSHAD